MKKNIFLHIGTFKTGTSSIQEFLFSHADELERTGFYVPRGQLIGHHDLPISLLKEFTKWRESWPAFSGDRQSIWGDIFQQIEKTSCNNIIISSENFCDLVNEHARSSAKEMGEVLKEYFAPYNVKVFAYLRSLDSYVKSMYGESIKVSPSTNSYSKVFREFIENESIHIHPSIYLDYFSDLFGKESVSVKLYLPDILVNGDVVDDFIDVLGIDASTKIGQSTARVNPSLSNDAVFLKRVFNISGIKGHEFNQDISNTLIQLNNILSGEEPGVLDAGEVDMLEAECDYILKNYGVDIGQTKDFNWVDNKKLTDVEGFIVALLSISIRQNKLIISRINEIERSFSTPKPRG